ncbi:MAG: MFS transporter [Chloroflexota bacterium]
MTSVPREDVPDTGIADVLKNRPFLLLWLAQAVTQIGGNMVLYGLTVIVVSTTDSNTAVSALILSFLVPAVLFSAVAGVYVDRIDRRLLLVVTNAIRGVAFVLVYFAGANLPVILLLTIFVSTVTVFFAPAEAAMIPYLVPRRQLLAANALFTLTLNAAFALGFALLGPLVVTLAGADQVILIVATLYLVAAAMCLTLPSSPPARAHAPVKPLQAVADAERAVESTLAQLREGLEYIRNNRAITWSLIYLGIASSLIGVLGVLGPDFARETLGLQPKDFVVVVLPLGAGIVMGILLLNSYGKYLPRRRVIEVGLIALGIALALLSVAGPISRFLQRAQETPPLIDLSALTSLLAIVVFIAFFAGIAYAIVAIPAQTQLAEDLPEDVRGRVFGVLNMLISVSSFLPIIIVGPISDVVGTGTVIFVVAILIGASGVASVIRRGPLKPAEWAVSAESTVSGVAVDPIGAMTHAEPPDVADAYPMADGANGDVPPWLRTRRAEERKAREEGREIPGVRSRVAKAAARISRRAEPRPVDPSAETVKIELPDTADDEGRRDRD